MAVPKQDVAALSKTWCATLDTRIDARWQELWQTLPRALDPTDAEGVHDLRVASRRLRAALAVGRVCHPGKGYATRQQTAKALTRALGAVRDGEVQRGLVRDQQATAGTLEQAALGHVAERLQRDERAGRRDLAVMLRRLRRSGPMNKLGRRALDAGPPSSVGTDALIIPARRVVAERAQAVAAYAPIVTQADAHAELHALRIAVKRLRYTVELFADELEPTAEPALARLKTLQDALGDVHDLDVLIGRLRVAVRRTTRRDRAGAAKQDQRRWGLALALAHAREARRGRHVAAVAAWTALTEAGMLVELSTLGTMATAS